MSTNNLFHLGVDDFTKPYSSANNNQQSTDDHLINNKYHQSSENQKFTLAQNNEGRNNNEVQSHQSFPLSWTCYQNKDGKYICPLRGD